MYLPGGSDRVSVGRPSWIPLSSSAVDNVNKVILGVLCQLLPRWMTAGTPLIIWTFRTSFAPKLSRLAIVLWTYFCDRYCDDALLRLIKAQCWQIGLCLIRNNIL